MRSWILFTANLVFGECPGVFVDAKRATARFDRLIHHCGFVETGRRNWCFRARDETV
ncbi:ATP-binding protein [Tritonibacter scottomollicae]|uniref:ATP-binding protein n=1 Tax=Tritonibacter scottomollicae TaxID=483013 RepID=UPI003AA9D854